MIVRTVRKMSAYTKGAIEEEREVDRRGQLSDTD